ncbi:RNA-binding protein 28 [Polypterus senegalus]|uniref:RNA-binding protein 28 n=1 Tax=Polypterus senegalus TaxID=55291 RepID=UPI0019637F22|nr:RNA-binding protein 28 [Polypterus senegalus]
MAKASTTLFVRNLPDSATSARLEEVFSDIGPVRECFVVKEKGSGKCKGYGYVTFSLPEDSEQALKTVKEYDGLKINVSIAKKKSDQKKKETKKVPKESKFQCVKKKSKLKSRLIIRNLSFKCTEDDLKETFSKYGTVLDVTLPRKTDGKMRGFAFVLFKNVQEASRALAAMNLKEIKGRPVAVDWVIAKDKYVASCSRNQEVDKTHVDGEDVSEEKDEVKAEAVIKKKPVEKLSNPASEKERSDSEVNSSTSSDEASISDSSEAEDSDTDSEENDLQNLDSADEENGAISTKKKTKVISNDVNEGRTVFIRNLAFDTDEEGLEEVLLRFGELKYIRIVLNPDTEHSKGCAFAQFKTKEATDSCIKAAGDDSETGGLKLDGRKLNIVLAVSREDAVKLKDKKVKKPTGTRNLYLAREGLIRSGTKAAEGLDPADLALRTKIEERKRKKLNDVNIFVSQTRLCIHNLPKSVDNKILHKLCLNAAGGGKEVKIKKCCVMYDRKPVAGKVLGRSLGYAFVEFSEHNHALLALRHLNNNPDIFGPKKRPIVEFSLEDRRKLKMKEMRIQRIQKNRTEGQAAKKNFKAGKRQPLTTQSKPSDSLEEKHVQKSWSGFITKSELEEDELPNGKKRKKVLPLPSHRGPKVRKRDKGKQPQQRQKKVNHSSRKERSQQISFGKHVTSFKQAPKKTFKKKEEDRFESLVEQYKRKILGGTKTNVRQGKWFNS